MYHIIRPTSKTLAPASPDLKHLVETTQKENHASRGTVFFATKSKSESREAMSKEKEFKETEKSWWLLKIIYNIVSGGELIIKLVQVQ